ncbi:arginine repressor [Niallia nealsonii]|uniref:Arginine repressor n=1 Tax=Niallia nealsonii TaxID=115979 RepID=A0A2N0Z438_9BACI|nr:hypothetical protein [Niallia nealsonii]PKG24273.1 hypothetical protein CWS01_07745 [Niallia nealsonii]
MTKNKSMRLNAMKKIIENRNVLTQEELKEELENLGYYVSQPTLSRDIKEIGGIREKYSKKYRFNLDVQNKINKGKIEKIINETNVSMNVPLHAIWFRISSEHAVIFANYIEKYLSDKGFHVMAVVGLTGNIMLGFAKEEANEIVRALNEVGLTRRSKSKNK